MLHLLKQYTEQVVVVATRSTRMTVAAVGAAMIARCASFGNGCDAHWAVTLDG